MNSNDERKEELQSIKEPASIQIPMISEPKNFSLSKEQISSLFDSYDLRTFDQDIQKIQELGDIQGIAEKLKTSTETGIQGDESDQEFRKLEYGENKLDEEEMPHFCEFVWEGLGDLMLRILIACGVAQIILGSIKQITPDPEVDWVGGFAVLVAVAVVVIVGSIINYDKEKKFKQLNDTSSEMVKLTVKRGGKSISIGTEEILVGDLLKIDYGNILFADGLVVSGKGLKIDESSLTGETNLVSKEEIDICLKQREKTLVKSKDTEINNKHAISSPLVYSGTLVKEGTGWMIVLAVGKDSKNGKIQTEIRASQEDEDSKTPLEIKLEDIADQIGKFGMIAAIFTMLALAIQLIIEETTMTTKDSALGQKIVNVFIIPIAIIVVAIPEGLPLAVTLSLAYSISKMMDEKNLVRKMPACETMGGANFVCTDKTGTLTENKMKVSVIFDNKETLRLGDKSDSEKIGMFAPDYLQFIKLSIGLNLNIEYDQNGEQIFSSKTDNAFSLLFQSLNGSESIENFRLRYFPQGMKDVRYFPFNSDRKKMSTIVTSEEFPKEGIRIFMKGASEIVLRSCRFFLDSSSCEPKTIRDEEMNNFEDTIKNFADASLRTICLAYKDISQTDNFNWDNLDSNGKNAIEEEGFILIGIVGINDPLREGVKTAIQKCEVASVRVIMVTGDNINTAVAIAKDATILKETDEEQKSAMLGINFHDAVGGIYCSNCNLSVKSCECPRSAAEAKKKGNEKAPLRKDKIRDMKKFLEITENLRVLARSRPEDKYLLVLGLKEAGNVVAVTGDGTNDAPALAKSDVGFAMGIQGTDIAKNVSDIILLDDNFSSIVRAIIWGRNIFDNIRKFLRFQMVVNLAAVGLVFLCAVIGNSVPLNTIQMLWINMIMDSLGSLALATEPPSDELLERKPYSRKESIISYSMWKYILIQSLFLLAITLTLYVAGPFFIYEDDATRISQISTIKSCYDTVPGGGISKDGAYLLSGLSLNWKNTYSLLNTTTYPALVNVCSVYISSNATNLNLAYTVYTSKFGGTAHLTMVFNTFVLYALFNQINSRILNDDFNIFKRIFVNKLFLLITFFEFFAHAIIVQFGSQAFQICSSGLTGKEWGICIGFGLVTYPVQVICKLIPLEYCLETSHNSWKNRTFCKSEEESEENEEEQKKLNQDDKILNPLVKRNSNPKLESNKPSNAPADQINESQVQRKQLKVTSLRRGSFSIKNKQASIKIMREGKHQ